MKKFLLLSAVALSAGIVYAGNGVPGKAVSRVSGSDLNVEKAVAFQQKSSSSLLKAAPVKVVGTQNLNDGNRIDFVEMSDGSVRKVLKGRSGKMIRNKVARQGYKAAGATSFYEGFEGYDGESSDWIPGGWEDVSKTNPPHVAPTEPKLPNLTWEGVVENLFSAPYAGSAMMRIQVSIADAEAGLVEEKQDEWLITPSFAVSASDYLYFRLSYSPAWTLLNPETMKFDALNNILEVHVSEDGGTNWTKVWDVTGDLKNYTEDELWNDAISYTHPYIPVLVDMNAYAGKSVKVAFRYVGQSGESMLIDEVTVGAVTPVASYERPAGTFYAGLSYDFMSLKNNILYGPRKQELTWYNTTEVASSYSWEYADPSDVEQMLTSSDVNLVTPVYEEDVIMVNAPALTASVGSSNSAPFKLTDYMQYGGNVFGVAESGDLINMDACIFNYPAYMREEIQMMTGNVFGYSPNIDATWSGILKETCTFDGVGTIIEKPKAPYALSYCFVRLYGDAISDNTVFKATVYRLTDEGTIGEELASGTTTKAEFYHPSPESWMTAIFQFEKKTGLFTEPVSLTVDYPIVIKLTAEVTDTDDFKYAGMFESEESTGQSYVFLKDAQGQTLYVPTTGLVFGSDGSTMKMTDFSISFDAAFTWVDCEENSYEAPEEGGSKTFNVSSYYELSEAVATIEGEGLNDWYTVTPGEFNAETAITPVEVTVKALPAGTDVRASSFTIAIPGSSKTFWLAQRSADSVEGVEAATTTVAVVDGDFVVTSANASAVAVYNVAGQKVAEAAVSGKTVVPGAGLANGMYILKFNDNTVVKVVK